MTAFSGGKIYMTGIDKLWRVQIGDWLTYSVNSFQDIDAFLDMIDKICLNLEFVFAMK